MCSKSLWVIQQMGYGAVPLDTSVQYIMGQKGMNRGGTSRDLYHQLRHRIPCYNNITMEKRLAARWKSAIWQIYLPLVLGSFAILSLGIWAVVVAVGGQEVTRFADVSVIFLLIPVMVLSLIPLAILGGLIFGVSRLIAAIPRATQRLHEVVERLQKALSTALEAAVEPILKLESMGAGLKAIFKKNR